MPVDRLVDVAARIPDDLLDVRTRVNGRIDAAPAELLPGVRRRWGGERADGVDRSDLVNARITARRVLDIVTEMGRTHEIGDLLVSRRLAEKHGFTRGDVPSDELMGA